MNDSQLLAATNVAKRGGVGALTEHLQKLGFEMRDYAYPMYTAGHLSAQQYEQLVGKPPPDPAKEEDFITWHTQLEQGKLGVRQLLGPYPDNNDDRYGSHAKHYISELESSGQLSDDDLLVLYSQGYFDKMKVIDYLIQGGRARSDVDDVLDLPKEMVQIGPDLMPTEASMLPDSNDVLMIGRQSAGKTMLLASFLHYLQEEISVVNILDTDQKSNEYAQTLISAVNNNQLVDRTAQGNCANVPLELRRSRVEKTGWLGKERENTLIYPINFTDISGEAYQRSLHTDIENLPSHLRSITFSQSNPKILLFTLPVGEYNIRYNTTIFDQNGVMRAQDVNITLNGFYANVLNMFHRHKVLDKTEGIALVITKWDKAAEEKYSSSEEFVFKKCQNLHNTIENLRTEHNYKYDYRVLTYQLSDVVDKDKNRYVHNPKGNKELYEWLTDTAYNRPKS